MLRAWTVLITRGRDIIPSMWVLEEPLFYNPALPVVALRSRSLSAGFIREGITRLQHLVAAGSWCSPEEVVSLTGIHSVHIIQKLITEVQNVVPYEAQHLLWSLLDFKEDLELFPEL